MTLRHNAIAAAMHLFGAGADDTSYDGGALVPVERAQHPGEMWRTIIETSGRSQADVARAIGMSNRHMNQIVLGKALPSAELTVAFAREMSTAVQPLWQAR